MHRAGSSSPRQDRESAREDADLRGSSSQQLAVPMLAKLADDQAASRLPRRRHLRLKRGSADLAREVYLFSSTAARPSAASAEAQRLAPPPQHEQRGPPPLPSSSSSPSSAATDAIEVNKLKPRVGIQADLRRSRRSSRRPPSSILDRDRLGTLPEVRKWLLGGPIRLVKRLAGFGPIVVNDPAVQFQLQSARRNLGDVGVARDWYTRYAAFVPKGPWHEAAVTEAWLAGAASKPRRLAYSSRFTERRPHLDGKLDDACWTSQPPMLLTDAAGGSAKDSPTEVWLAYDPEYLYLAVRCKHAVGQRVLPVKTRSRDAEPRRIRSREPDARSSTADYASYVPSADRSSAVVAREDCTVATFHGTRRSGSWPSNPQRRTVGLPRSRFR